MSKFVKCRNVFVVIVNAVVVYLQQSQCLELRKLFKKAKTK